MYFCLFLCYYGLLNRNMKKMVDLKFIIEFILEVFLKFEFKLKNFVCGVFVFMVINYFLINGIKDFLKE